MAKYFQSARPLNRKRNIALFSIPPPLFQTTTKTLLPLCLWLVSPWHTGRSLHYTPIHAPFSQRPGGELPAHALSAFLRHSSGCGLVLLRRLWAASVCRGVQRPPTQVVCLAPTPADCTVCCSDTLRVPWPSWACGSGTRRQQPLQGRAERPSKPRSTETHVYIDFGKTTTVHPDPTPPPPPLYLEGGEPFSGLTRSPLHDVRFRP